MRERFLPPFTLPVPFSERQVSIDLVEIRVAGLSILGDAEYADRVLRRINELKVLASDGTKISLFNKPHRTLVGGQTQAKITTAGELHNERRLRPVFAGRLIASRRRDPTSTYCGSRDLTEISLSLKLNVARFLSAQRFRVFGEKRRVSAVRPLALAYSSNFQIEDDEVSFGNDGNVVMGSQLVYTYAVSGRPYSHFFNLLQSIVETIASWIEDRLDSAYNRLQRSVHYSLSHIEWYSEFGAHDPRRIVARLMPVLARLGKRGNVFRRRLNGQVKQFGPHSHGLQIELSAGKKQTTYCKTNRRIRFEVKYGRKSFHGIFGRRTGLNQDGLSLAIEKTRRNAIKELASIFRCVNRLSESMPDHKTRDDLCLVIGAHSESLGIAEEILRSLRQKGAITVENTSILRPSIDRLSSSEIGVLRYVRHSVYTVTDEFELALRELMGQRGAEQAPRDGGK